MAVSSVGCTLERLSPSSSYHGCLSGFGNNLAHANAVPIKLSSWGSRHEQCKRRTELRLLKELLKQCTYSRSPFFPTARRGHIMAVATETSKTVEQQPVPSPPKLSAQTPDCQFSPLPPIKEAKRVVLVRHGESTWNQAGRIQGSSDFAVLTEKGIIQAETSRQMLADANFDALFHSPLARSKRTAEIIWDKRTGPVYPVDDLREIDLYAFQGLYKEEGKERFGEQYKMWQKDAANFEIDGHYPVRELWARARSCWDLILKDKSRSALVVAHNAVNQALVATATGLDPIYFRLLLQSNCGVSVLDFTPNADPDGPPKVSLERLNQTPGPPIAASAGTSAGRKAKCRLVLVRHGATDSTLQGKKPATQEEPMNMLGVVQSRKTAELLLDVTIDTIVTSPTGRAVAAAEEIRVLQENAYCLKDYCEPRFVDTIEVPELQDLNLQIPEGESAESLSQDGNGKLNEAWEQAGRAWKKVLEVLENSGEEGDKLVLVVGHESTHVAMISHCLGLTPDYLDRFHLQTGSVSVIDFPDGPSGRGVVRCLNYTAHLGRWAIPVTRPDFKDEEY